MPIGPGKIMPVSMTVHVMLLPVQVNSDGHVAMII